MTVSKPLALATHDFESINLFFLYQRTDSSSNGRGFSASYKTACGGRKIVGNGVETIRSPNYPHNYDPNTNCTWTLMGALPGMCSCLLSKIFNHSEEFESQ